GRPLLLMDWDGHFAADIVRHSVLQADPLHRLLANAAVGCIQRAGLVVDAGMEHAGIMAGLMCADLRLLFNDPDRQLRALLRQVIRRCQSDDPSSENGDVRMRHAAVLAAETAVGEGRASRLCLYLKCRFFLRIWSKVPPMKI